MYLSVDIDFWNHIGITPLRKALEAIAESGKLRQVSDNHKYLLRSIRASRERDIVNVDTHSDIISVEDESMEPELNCGTWVNHLGRPFRGTYQWVFPNGYDHPCHCEGNPFEDSSQLGWGAITKRGVDGFPKSLIKDASHIGISISYYWLRYYLTFENVQPILKEILGKMYPQREFSCK